MIKPGKPDNEAQRLSALQRLQILDSAREESYDDLLAIATGICQTPMGVVSLVDEDRQWFKARHGIDGTQTPRDHSFCAHAILEPNQMLVVADARRDPRFVDNPLVTGDPNVRFYAGAPLVTADGFALGTLCVFDSEPRDLQPSQLRALQALSRQVAALLELRRASHELQHHHRERDWYELRLLEYQQELEAHAETLLEQTRVDALTGLLNRRGIDAALAEIVAAHDAGGAAPLVAILDIDHFKLVNDTHGHEIGDLVLAAVARTLHAEAGDGALVGRQGGEEFVVVLQAHSACTGLSRIEHLLSQVRELRDPLIVTLSAGLAVREPGEDVNAWLARADRALYVAKRSGRNRAVLA